MSKNKKPASSAAPCASAVLGETCKLTGDHTTHTNSDKRAGQYMTWERVGDVFQVTTYQGKKKTGGWPEPAPADIAPPVPQVCDREPDDEDDDPLADEIRSDEERDLARKMREDREAHARELEAATPDQLQPGEHDWEKSNLFTQGKGGRTFDTYRCKACAATSKRYGFAWPPKLDVKQPKKCKATSPTATSSPTTCSKAAEPEIRTESVTTAPTVGWTEEVAPQPGDARSNERGQGERWCWGLVGGWGWRSYPTSKGKGCTGCGRHKADCLCKQMKAAPIATVAPAPSPSPGPKILGMHRHPAAALFPLMEGEELEAFIERIRKNGLRKKPVLVTIDGETFILDGSNRGVACERLGIKPEFEHYEGPKDMDSLVAYSIDANGEGRRHLDPSIRAMIAAKSATLGRGNPGETGRTSGLTQAEAGKRLGVSDRLVRRAVVVRDKATPKVNEAVMKGRLSVEAAEAVTKLPDAKQDQIADEALARKRGQMKGGRVKALVRQEEKRAVVRDINSGRVAPMPRGPFGLIYGDYPWPYENSDQHDGSRGHMPYPPMQMAEILAHARDTARRASKHCIVALWGTNLHIVNGNVTRVIEAYGATPHSMFTWPKQKAGVGTWGRGQTEHLIIASIGKPTHTLNEISTLLESFAAAQVGEHSSKPEEVAELLAEHCSGPFLELFARDDRGGAWACWGAEVDKFATEAA